MKNIFQEFSKLEDPLKNVITEESQIQKFYKGKNIFLTGGTGFFGKVIIEKLLRVTEVSQIYLLVRVKKGKDVFTRLEDIFNDPLFEKLKTAKPKYRERITIISGDCSLHALGISQSDRELITDNVHIVIHSAATVRFEEELKLAIAINVNGTKEILKLAKDIVHLKAFVHVSTAFAHCNHKHIEEKYYDINITGDNALKLSDCLDEHTLNTLTTNIIGGYPNTYTFTKVLAENIVQNYAERMPLTIFRPGIVITTLEEPIAGWIDNMYGPCGVIVGVGSGVLRVLSGKVDNKAHLVPVDLCVNGLLASAWDTATTSHETTPIYNYVPDDDNIITWREFLNHGWKLAREIPLRKSIWYPRFTLVDNIWLYHILCFFYHTLPALFIDLLLLIIGKKPKMMKIYIKISKFSSVMRYFTNNDFKFDNYNVRQLWNKLEANDQKLFAFDMRNMDWKKLFRVSLIGVRIYVVKDDLSTIPDAVKRNYRLRILHYTTLFIVYSLTFAAFWQIFKLVFL